MRFVLPCSNSQLLNTDTAWLLAVPGELQGEVGQREPVSGQTGGQRRPITAVEVF